MHYVGAHSALRFLHQLLDLLCVVVDEPRSTAVLQRVTACITQPHVPLHRLAIRAGELGRRVRTAGQVVCLEYLHDLLVALGQARSSGVGCDVSGDVFASHGSAQTVRTGSFPVRSPGDLVSASREFPVRLPGE